MKRLLLMLLAIGLILWLIKPELLQDWADRGHKLVKGEVRRHYESAVLSAATNVNQYLQKTSETVLGEKISLPFKEKIETEIIKDVPKQDFSNIILIDYLTAKNLRLNFQPNQDYYLDLRNVPKTRCLYINQSTHPIDKNEFLKVNFRGSGIFSLTFEKCDQKQRPFGEIVVE